METAGVELFVTSVLFYKCCQRFKKTEDIVLVMMWNETGRKKEKDLRFLSAWSTHLPQNLVFICL